MPSLVSRDLLIASVGHRRIWFDNVRIGQIFYAQASCDLSGRWWQKITLRTAVRADETGKEKCYFKKRARVRVFDETRALRVKGVELKGLSFDEFVNSSSLG
jgi:hypothetical protein